MASYFKSIIQIHIPTFSTHKIMNQITQVHYQGILENLPYGVPFEWKCGNPFSINRFLAYVLQNQFELINRWKEKHNAEFESDIFEALDNVDEFEVVNFYNLETFDTSLINFDEVLLKRKNNEIYFYYENIELVFPSLDNIVITHRDLPIPKSKLKNYVDKRICIEYEPETRMIFMTEGQVARNLEYLNNHISKLFKPFKIRIDSSTKTVSKIFKLE